MRFKRALTADTRRATLTSPVSHSRSANTWRDGGHPQDPPGVQASPPRTESGLHASTSTPRRTSAAAARPIRARYRSVAGLVEPFCRWLQGGTGVLSVVTGGGSAGSRCSVDETGHSLLDRVLSLPRGWPSLGRCCPSWTVTGPRVAHRHQRHSIARLCVSIT